MRGRSSPVTALLDACKKESTKQKEVGLGTLLYHPPSDLSSVETCAQMGKDLRFGYGAKQGHPSSLADTYLRVGECLCGRARIKATTRGAKPRANDGGSGTTSIRHRAGSRETACWSEGDGQSEPPWE